MAYKKSFITIEVMNDHDIQNQINTEFDWRIYADATFSGLSELIPIPMIDWLFARLFWRRMPTTIARRHGRHVPQRSLKAINQRGEGCSRYLLFMLILPIEIIKRISRTILYFFTIHAAARSLSANWKRAFLLDYSIQQGHLDQPLKAEVTAATIDQIVKKNNQDPLLQLAREVMTHATHILRSMLFIIRNKEDKTMDMAQEQMRTGWDNVRGNLVELAWLYDAQWTVRYAEVSESSVTV